MTERGILKVPRKGVQVSLISQDVVAIRPMLKTANGVMKRDGTVSVISSGTPDSSFAVEHPLVSADFSRSESICKEIYGAL